MQNKDLLRVGGIGAILWLVAILIVIIYIMILASAPEVHILGAMAALPYYWMQIVSVVAQSAGIVMLSLGAIGASKKYGSRMCNAAGIAGIVGGLLVLAWLGIGLIACPHPFVPSPPCTLSSLDWTLTGGFLSVVLAAILLIALGSGLINIQKKTGVGMTRTVGILTLITGVLYLAGIVVLTTLIAILLTIPTMVLLCIVFLKAK